MIFDLSLSLFDRLTCPLIVSPTFASVGSAQKCLVRGVGLFLPSGRSRVRGGGSAVVRLDSPLYSALEFVVADSRDLTLANAPD
jgi:hypothetical protein